MTIIERLFPKAAELEAARKRIEVLEADKEELQRRHTNLWESYNSHDATVQKQRTEIAELKGKLREQNDADLLLVSARIAVAVLKGHKPEASDLAMQQQLLAHSSYYAQMQGANYRSSTGGLLSALGLGGILG